MPDIPDARIIASVKGGKSVHERECPVCGERIREKRTEKKTTDEQGTQVIESSVASTKYEKHYTSRHAG